MSTGGVAAAEPRQGGRTAVVARRRGRRIRFLVAGLILLAALGYLIYSAVAGNSEYYLTVSEAYASAPAQEAQVKVGGKVVEGSIAWDRGSSTVRFTITDGQKTMPVTYKGVVPDSFQPGADVILEGKMTKEGDFAASSLLAKCASKYEAQIPGVSK